MATSFITTGEIPSAAKATSTGLFAVKIRFDSDAAPRHLSMGSGGSAAIYTNKGKPVHIISKVALRMKKWLLYVIPSVQILVPYRARPDAGYSKP
jgi:hypothetical protein